jgi:hypothetical protein
MEMCKGLGCLLQQNVSRVHYVISLNLEWIHWIWLNKDNEFVGPLKRD